jgi:hypothetical protein
MALADPVAVAMFALAGWSLVNWARYPTKKRTILSGVLLLLTPFAKLTGAAIVFAPFLALILFYLTPRPPLHTGEGEQQREILRNQVPSPRWQEGGRAFYDRSRRSLPTPNGDLGVRFIRPLVMIYVIFAAFWIPLMTPTFLGEIRGGEHRMELVDEYLLNAYEEDQSFVPNLLDNIWDAFSQIGIYTWTPVIILTVILGLMLVFLRWRAAFFLWGMLALAWLPTLAGSEMARTRYLTLGLPFLILLLTVGLYALIDRLPGRRLIERGIFVGLLVYALAWGLPFFRTASSNPAELTLPERDRWRYIQAVTAGYGQQEAAFYLENDLNDYPIDVFGILGSCHLMRMFLQEPGPVRLICADLVPVHQLTESEIDEIEAAGADGDLYLLIERSLGTNFDDLNFEWDFVREFERPHAGVTIELWRVTPR